MTLTSEQYALLSELLIDIAKGSFLAGLAVPLLSPQATLFITFRSFLIAIACTYYALIAVKLKEVNL